MLIAERNYPAVLLARHGVSLGSEQRKGVARECLSLYRFLDQ